MPTVVKRAVGERLRVWAALLSSAATAAGNGGRAMGPWLVSVARRDELDPWLEGGAPLPYLPVVLIVRGDGDVIRELLPNALDAAKQQPHRVVVWVRNEDLFHEREAETLFRGEPDIVAAVLAADRRVRAFMYTDRIGVADAAFAFARAEAA